VGEREGRREEKAKALEERSGGRAEVFVDRGKAGRSSSCDKYHSTGIG